MNTPIAVFLKGYPRLSETFVAQEIHALEQAGLALLLVSLRHPTDTERHPVHDEIQAPVVYLPEYLYQEPMRVLRGWWKARRLPGYGSALRQFLADLRRDRTPNRIRRFGQALVAAAELPGEIDRYYSHFIHTPGSVARYAATMTGVRWSCSAHAKDIWTTPDWELTEKLDAADWVVTCTRTGTDHLSAFARMPDRVHLVYHGLDLSRFRPPAVFGSGRDGTRRDDPVRILTVGRAVEKKGLDGLLEALAALPPELFWQWTHIGGGPLLGTLKDIAGARKLGDRVAFRGSQSQSAVLEAYREADLFVLPCRIADDGDRDGLPNVIVEAMSQGLPCISTPVSGVPELVRDGENGLLVPPDDGPALTEAIVKLCRDPERRRKMGRAGLERVGSEFSITEATAKLLALFGAETSHVRGDLAGAA